MGADIAFCLFSRRGLKKGNAAGDTKNLPGLSADTHKIVLEPKQFGHLSDKGWKNRIPDFCMFCSGQGFLFL